MRHQRHFAKPAATFVRIHRLDQYILSLGGMRLDDAAALELDRDVGDQRAIVAEWFGGTHDAVNAQTMGSGEYFLGRNVGIAGDAVARGRGAALPGMALGETERQVCAWSHVFEGREVLAG